MARFCASAGPSDWALGSPFAPYGVFEEQCELQMDEENPFCEDNTAGIGCGNQCQRARQVSLWERFAPPSATPCGRGSPPSATAGSAPSSSAPSPRRRRSSSSASTTCSPAPSPRSSSICCLTCRAASSSPPRSCPTSSAGALTPPLLWLRLRLVRAAPIRLWIKEEVSFFWRRLCLLNSWQRLLLLLLSPIRETRATQYKAGTCEYYY